MLKSSRIVMSIAVALGCAVALQAQTPTTREGNRTVPAEIDRILLLLAAMV